MKKDFSTEYIESFEYYIEKAQRLQVIAEADPAPAGQPAQAAPAPAKPVAGQTTGAVNGQLDLQPKAIRLIFNLAGGDKKSFVFDDDKVKLNTLTLNKAIEILAQVNKFQAGVLSKNAATKGNTLLKDLVMSGDHIEFKIANGVIDINQ